MGRVWGTRKGEVIRAVNSAARVEGGGETSPEAEMSEAVVNEESILCDLLFFFFFFGHAMRHVGS